MKERFRIPNLEALICPPLIGVYTGRAENVRADSKKISEARIRSLVEGEEATLGR